MRNIEAFEMFTKLNSQTMDNTQSLPVKVSFKIVKNKFALKAMCEPYVETRNAIIRSYADGKQTIEQTDPNYAECMRKLTELDNANTTVSIEKIKFSDIENLDLPIEFMNAIYFMVEE